MSERANAVRWAIALLISIFAGCGESKEELRIRLADEEVQLGMILAKGGDHDLAISYFTDAIMLNPECGQAFVERGAAKIWKQPPDLESAIEDLNTAIEMDSGSRAYLIRGLAYVFDHQLDLAIADFSEAIRIEPSMYAAWRGRSLAHFMNGNKEQATKDQQTANLFEEADPDRDGVLWWELERAQSPE